MTACPSCGAELPAEVGAAVIAERVEQARAEGRPPGRTPFAHRAVVERLLELRALGLSYRKVARILTAEHHPVPAGGRRRPGTQHWAPSTVRFFVEKERGALDSGAPGS